ncbi:MAG: anti-sigma factor [Stackebrandtia sp.]
MNARAHTLVAAYVLDAVDDAERKEVERHLSECDECAEEVFELRAATARLADVAVAEPPDGMREAVMLRVRRTRQDPPAEGSPQDVLQPKRIRPWRRVVAEAALAIVMALAGGTATYAVMQQRLPDENSRSEQIAAVLTADDARVAAQEAEGGGTVAVVFSPSLDQAVVTASELAHIGAQRSYQFWLVSDDVPESAGVMAAGERSATMLVSDVGDAGLVGVTVEPAGGSPGPTSPMTADVALSR